jgi:hypothetical protein
LTTIEIFPHTSDYDGRGWFLNFGHKGSHIDRLFCHDQSAVRLYPHDMQARPLNAFNAAGDRGFGEGQGASHLASCRAAAFPRATARNRGFAFCESRRPTETWEIGFRATRPWKAGKFVYSTQLNRICGERKTESTVSTTLVFHPNYWRK